MSNEKLALALAAICAASPASTQPQPTASAPPTGYGARIEVPIRAVRLSNGAMRYAVPVTIDGHPIDAGLDTGSTGLRVMARALPGVAAGARPVRYGYGSGTALVGSEVRISASIGNGPTIALPVQKVDEVRCAPSTPRCPASRNDDPRSFGIMGDGIPNEGFAAILGTGIFAEPIPNPLQAFGARRWIVELPETPGAPGRLVLNPAPAETAAYAVIPLTNGRSTFPVCVQGPGVAGRFCGTANADTGAGGISIATTQAHGRPRRGAPIRVLIGDGGRAASFTFAIDAEAGSRVSFDGDPGGETAIRLGFIPYRKLSILYDAERRTIGFRPR